MNNSTGLKHIELNGFCQTSLANWLLPLCIWLVFRPVLRPRLVPVVYQFGVLTYTPLSHVLHDIWNLKHHWKVSLQCSALKPSYDEVVPGTRGLSNMWKIAVTNIDYMNCFMLRTFNIYFFLVVIFPAWVYQVTFPMLHFCNLTSWNCPIQE